MSCSNKSNSCIDKVPIFKNLNHDEKIEIAMITNSKNYKKGEMIYGAGDVNNNLFVIHKGKVKTNRISSDGKEQVLRILESGDFLGELSLFLKSPHSDNAEVLEDATVCVIQGDKLEKLLLKYPKISIKILEELSKRLNSSEDTIEGIGIHTVDIRVAKELLSSQDDDGSIELDISKRDLASKLGMSRETLSRKLSEFKDKGFIELIGQRKIEILNEIELENLIKQV